MSREETDTVTTKDRTVDTATGTALEPVAPLPAIFERPARVRAFEARVGRAIPLHPNVLSGLKLAMVPLLLLSLPQVAWLPVTPWFVLLAFGLFAALDYLDGVVARERGLCTRFGLVFDRLTDAPILLGLSLLCHQVLPVALVLAKLGIDCCLLVLFLRGRGPTESRIRTVVSDLTLLALFLLSQGWGAGLITPLVVQCFLWLSIFFAATVALCLSGIFQLRFLATVLSGGNLSCGLAMIVFAVAGQPAFSLLFLALGVLFDGVDGATARRFGSTSWGVYADDVADGVTNAVAPGVVLGVAIGGSAGVVCGGLYAAFTIGRLVYFTLDKGAADPRWFAGAPSTVGAFTVVCAAILFSDLPALLGLLCGAVCVLMVSFDTRYRHLGRLLKERPRLAWLIPLHLLFLLGCFLVGGLLWPVAVVLATSLAYGLLPVAQNLRRVAARASA